MVFKLLIDCGLDGGGHKLVVWLARLLGRFLDAIVRVVGGWCGRVLRRTAHVLVCTTVLLHVVFARESLVAFRAERVFLASVLFRVTSGVTGRGKVIGALIFFSHWARVLILLWLLKLVGAIGRVRIGAWRRAGTMLRRVLLLW